MNVLSNIFKSPKTALSYIDRSGYSTYFYLILFFLGATQGASKLLNSGVQSYFALSSFTVTAILGGLMGWIGLYLYAVLIQWSGSLLGGQAKSWRIFRVLTYANLPFFLAVLGICIFKILMIRYHGYEGMTEETVDYIGVFLKVCQAGLSLWSVYLYCLGISAVQGFSTLKSFLNLFLAGVLIVIPFSIVFFASLF